LEVRGFTPMRRRSTIAALGVGYLIVFIAIVLVASMAAMALLQVGQQLQLQSTKSGAQTVTDVSMGVRITTIQGWVSNGQIRRLVMIITPWAGSSPVDMSRMSLELSTAQKKLVLRYNGSAFADATTGTNNVFAVAAFPSVGSNFGLIKLTDSDGSCTAASPVLSRGDNVMVAVNVSVGFGGLGVSQHVLGVFLPENGAPSFIDFITPTAYPNPVVILRQG